MRHLRRQPFTLHREIRLCLAFLNREDGHASVEYGILLSFMGGAILAGAIALGSSLSSSMSGSAVLLASSEQTASASSTTQPGAEPEDHGRGVNGPERAENRRQSNSGSAGKSGISGQMSAITANKPNGGRKK